VLVPLYASGARAKTTPTCSPEAGTGIPSAAYVHTSEIGLHDSAGVGTGIRGVSVWRVNGRLTQASGSWGFASSTRLAAGGGIDPIGRRHVTITFIHQLPPE
jgi:hypothetical protein